MKDSPSAVKVLCGCPFCDNFKTKLIKKKYLLHLKQKSPHIIARAMVYRFFEN